jgi:hypothetical protein
MTIATLLAALAGGALTGAGALALDTIDTDAPRVCFDRASWDADPGDRPCARIVRVYEDASVCVRVGPADRSVSQRACVGNPFDRR